MNKPTLRARRLFARGLAAAGEGLVWTLDLTGRLFVSLVAAVQAVRLGGSLVLPAASVFYLRRHAQDVDRAIAVGRQQVAAVRRKRQMADDAERLTEAD